MRIMKMAKTFLAVAIILAGEMATPCLAQSSGTPDSDISRSIYIYFQIGCAIAAFQLRRRRGENGIGWAIVAFIFPLSIIALAFLPKFKNGQFTKPDKNEIEIDLRHIRNGELAFFRPTGILPMPGEKFFWSQRCRYGQTSTQMRTSRGYSSVYVPVAGGFGINVGGGRGSSRIDKSFTWGPYGTVYLSDQRILVVGDNGQTAYTEHTYIIKYEALEDQLVLHVANIGMMRFKTGDARLGAVFGYAAQPGSVDALASYNEFRASL